MGEVIRDYAELTKRLNWHRSHGERIVSTNGVFDNSGNRIGYETKTDQGVTNIFDNNGNRIGYSPSKQK